MDDLDLEKLKKELHDVSGSSLYDVDQIMEEAGSSESGSSSSMEELMQSLGVQTLEEPKTQPFSASKPEEQEREALASLQQASEQTQAMIEEQEDMQTWLKPEDDREAEPASQPEDDVFGSLFAQLGELEREEIPMDPRTELMPESEEEPSLMERLFPSASEPEIEVETQALELEEESQTRVLESKPDISEEPEEPEEPTRRVNEQDYEDLIEQATLRVQQADDDSDEEESADAPEQKLNTSNDAAISQIVEALAKEPEAEPQKDEKPAKQGMFTRLFAPPEVAEETADEDALDEEGREEVREEPEDLEEAEEPEEKPARKGLFSRLFAPRDELEEIDVPIDVSQLQGLDESEQPTEAAEDQPQTQILEPEQELPETEEEKILEQKTPKEVFDQLLDDDEKRPESIELEPEQNPEPEKTKDGILNKVRGVLGLEIVEEDDGTEQPRQSEPELGEVPEQQTESEQEEPESTKQELEKQPPQPRPEDTPVISEDEFAAFMSDVDAEETEKCASFEELLQDSSETAEDEKTQPLRKESIIPETFPDEETTIYVNVPVHKQVLEKPQPRQTELFDVEEALKQKPLFDKSPEQEAPEQPEEMPNEPLLEPEWLGKPLEEICKTAPSLEELRKEGPVMTREVLRRKEWIAARVRRYQAEQNGETYPPQPESEPKVEPIHASDAWEKMPEQETVEDDSVFPEGSTDKPETEAVGQKSSIQESVIEIEASETTPEQDVQEEQSRTEAKPMEDAPKQRQKMSVKKKTISQDLTQESRICRFRARNKAIRSTVLGVLTLICLYISCAADFTILPLPSAMDYASHSGRVLSIFLLMLACAIVLAYDVVWDGIQAVLHGSPNFSTLVDAALLLNLLHCGIRLASEGEEIPFACIAMLILFAQLRAQVSEETVKHYTYKVAGTSREPVGIFWHDGKTPHLVKAPMADIDAFVSQTAACEKQKRMERLFTLSALVIAVILSVIVCALTGDAGRLIYVLAATVTGSCQIALLSASVMARRSAARRLAHCGAAADGDEGVDNMATTQTVVLSDEDLFPNGSVILVSLEPHSSLNDATALAYAAALTQNSSLGNMLAEEVRTRYGTPLAAHRIIRYDGGIGGQIGGLQVLLGSESFMASRGIPVNGMAENALALSLDGRLAAVLTIDYTVPAVLFHAMQKLTEQKTTIWLHSRNQQITPKLVERLYGLPEGTVIVPDLEQKRKLQNSAYTRDARLCALLVRDGLMGTADCICAARAQRKAQRAGILIGICASIVCMLLMMYLCYAFVPSDAHPIRLLIYMVLCFIPIFFLDNGVGRE